MARAKGKKDILAYSTMEVTTHWPRYDGNRFASKFRRRNHALPMFFELAMILNLGPSNFLSDHVGRTRTQNKRINPARSVDPTVEGSSCNDFRAPHNVHKVDLQMPRSVPLLWAISAESY